MRAPGRPIRPMLGIGNRFAGKGQKMMNNFDEMQKMSKDNMDMAMASFGSFSKGFQAIAAEMADYQKKSFEEGSAAVEKLVSSKSLDKAFEAQADYVKTAYEGFVGEMTKIGEMVTDMSKDAYKPYEGVMGKLAK
jgi:phasin family protein